MKGIISILIAVLILCFGPRVKILEKTSQDWYGGQYETGKGTDYVLKMKARGGSDKLDIIKLWVGDEMYEVEAVKDLAKLSDQTFERGDIIYVKAGKHLKPDDKGRMVNVSGTKIKPPLNYTGAALLMFTWKGKNKYIEIEDFKILEKIIYP